MATNISEGEKMFLKCANWGDAIEIDNSASAKDSSTWICIINTILSVHAVLLNALIITVYYKDRRLQTIPNILIISLAMADLFVGILGQPVAIIIHALKLHEIHSCSLELLSFFLTETSLGLSCTTVCYVIPLERFFAVIFPLKHRTLVTKRRLKTAIVILALFFVVSGTSFVFAMPLMIIFTAQFFTIIFGIVIVAGVYLRIFFLVRERTKSGRISQGVTSENHASSSMGLKQTTPLSTPELTSKSTPQPTETRFPKSTPNNICHLKTPADNQAQSTSKDWQKAQKETERMKKEKRVLKSMVIISGALVICFMPRCVSIMCMVSGAVNVQVFYTYLLPWTDVMCYVNSSFNPYIYFFRNKDISEATKRIIFRNTRSRQVDMRMIVQPK